MKRCKIKAGDMWVAPRGEELTDDYEKAWVLEPAAAYEYIKGTNVFGPLEIVIEKMCTIRMTDVMHRELVHKADTAKMSINEYCLVALGLKPMGPRKPIRGRRAKVAPRVIVGWRYKCAYCEEEVGESATKLTLSMPCPRCNKFQLTLVEEVV